MIRANLQITFYTGNNYLQLLCESWLISGVFRVSFSSDWWFWTFLFWAVQPDLILKRLRMSALSEIETLLKVSSCAYRKSLLAFSNPSCRCSVSWPYMSKNQGNWRSVGHKNASRVWLFHCRNNTRVYNSIYRRKMTLTKSIQTNVTSLTSAGTWILTYIIGTCCQVNSKS